MPPRPKEEVDDGEFDEDEYEDEYEEEGEEGEEIESGQASAAAAGGIQLHMHLLAYHGGTVLMAFSVGNRYCCRATLRRDCLVESVSA